jgi:hypothetical protein
MFKCRALVTWKLIEQQLNVYICTIFIYFFLLLLALMYYMIRNKGHG